MQSLLKIILLLALQVIFAFGVANLGPQGDCSSVPCDDNLFCYRQDNKCYSKKNQCDANCGKDGTKCVRTGTADEQACIKPSTPSTTSTTTTESSTSTSISNKTSPASATSDTSKTNPDLVVLGNTTKTGLISSGITMKANSTVPEVTTTVPEITTTLPEVTTTVPETTTTVPETTTTVLEITTTLPEVTTTVPEVTTTVPEVTTAVPEITTVPEVTTKPSTTSSGCVDKLNCKPYAYLCDNAAYYQLMTEQCPKTCNRCNTSTTPAPCNDLTEPDGTSNCQVVAYLCNSVEYYNLMTQQCPKTCGRCPGQTVTSIPTMCADKVDSDGVSNCAEVAYLCDNQEYYSLMTQQCPKTCNRC